MKRCPLTYEPMDELSNEVYSAAGLRGMSPRLTSLADLPWSAEEQRREARARAGRLSIQGVQPKLSARLRVSAGRFAIVDSGGTYILKPQVELYDHLPENEDLTMRLASAAGIEVPRHGLVRSRDGSWTYFVRRFDRAGRGKKLAVEDFAQLAGRDRWTKYDSSMERVAALVEEFCTFALVEKHELFRRTLFCFLTGNEDMHLKNFSVITQGPVVKLSPAYDLVNTTLALPGTKEELALPLCGKKARLKRADLLDTFGRHRLGLTDVVIEKTLAELADAQPEWERLIAASFLPDTMREAYAELVTERTARVWG